VARRLALICLILLCIYWAGLFVMTHLPPGRLPVVPVTDKTEHFTSYAVLAIGLLICLSLLRGARVGWAVLVLGICMAYGAIDEWTQIPVGRTCDIADWYADTSGAASAVVLGSIVMLGARKARQEPAAPVSSL
jgi:VanZ family protein